MKAIKREVKRAEIIVEFDKAFRRLVVKVSKDLLGVVKPTTPDLNEHPRLTEVGFQAVSASPVESA